jgi:FkbH-like protein
MSTLKYSEILAANQQLKKTVGGSEYPVGILSNITVNQLSEILEFTLRNAGINANCTVGNYDNIMQDASEFSSNKLVVIFWELANLIDGLQYKAALMDEVNRNELVAKVKHELTFVFNALKVTSRVVINEFSSLVFNYHNLDSNALDDMADELNAFLHSQKPDNFTIVALDKVIANTGIENSTDTRYFYSSKALYSIDFYKAWCNLVLPLARSLNGKAKKALIFDCDNTLWKGILGEDGFDNILVSSTQPGGAPYEEVQSLAKSLTSEGIVLGLCSKNNPDDVDEVLEKHPGMTLRNADLTIKRVNWSDKVSNLKDIAKSLNIGLDSLVFVDDSDFEVNFVRENLPEVTVIQVPKRTADYPAEIRKNLGLFFNVSKTAEDIKRVKMYKEQVKREEAKTGFDTLESYIRSLEITLEIYVDDAAIIPRMSQMTQKTNQFNLTTRRYSEADIQKFVESPDYHVIAIGVKDKYGDNGITGLTIVRKDGDKAVIDSLLMSCRIIGRNIEYRYMDYILDFLTSQGIKEVKADYLKTLKNAQVESFFDKMGFNLAGQTADHKQYNIETNSYKNHDINYMHIKDGR